MNISLIDVIAFLSASSLFFVFPYYYNWIKNYKDYSKVLKRQIELSFLISAFSLAGAILCFFTRPIDYLVMIPALFAGFIWFKIYRKNRKWSKAEKVIKKMNDEKQIPRED